MRLLPRTFVLSFFALFCCGLHDQAAAQRMTVDQPDDSFSPQIHVMYILPNDGTDEQLDTNGTIKTSVRAFQNWITGQLGGRQLRLDTFQGDLDMTFVRLTQSDAELSSTGPFVRDQIEQELKAAGFDRSDKIYAVYYGGGSTFACGGGAWPPTLPGNVAALYLKGTPPGAIPCAANSFAPDENTPGYWDFSMLHEILHTMGVVATCAPNHTLAGHVSDDPRDVMYAGSQPWDPSILDINRNDYFDHGNSGCLDLSDSPFLENLWPLYFAQIGNGQGLTSEIVLINPSATETVSGQINFFNDDGSPLSIEIASVEAVPLTTARSPAQTGSSVSFSVAPLGSVVLSTNGQGNPVTGAAVVTPSGPLGGVIRFRLDPFGIAGVGASQPVTGFITPVRRKAGGINTGVALYNPGDQTVTLDLALRQGENPDPPIATRQIELSANGHLAQFVGGAGEVLFSNADTDDFVGTLVVEVAGGKVAATVLELGTEPGQFTTLPVTPLE